MGRFNFFKVRDYDITPAIMTQDVLKIHVNWGEIENLISDGSKNFRALRTFQRHGSHALASWIARKARALLEVGNPRREIGATGRASENIFIRRVGGGGEKEGGGWIVYEGSYRGNMWIRLGREKGGDPPPTKAIIEWMVHKPGFPFRPPKRQKTWKRLTKKGGPRANLSSQPPRPFKADLPVLGRIIAVKIAERGIKHFREFEPKGRPRYDYYGEILRRRGPIRTYMKRMFSQEASAYFEFLRTGAYRRLRVRKIGGIEK